jgi:hypothetical protein
MFLSLQAPHICTLVFHARAPAVFGDVILDKGPVQEQKHTRRLADVSKR